MARRVITIEEKIERQTAEVANAKKKYDLELDKLNALLEKKKEMESRELMKAFSKSSRSYKEVMDFLKTK
ncbi:MAG: ErpK protein [Lachnospiraceae bacterium]|nr:ErpK protein [Lachnospiraceae bacterium]